MPTAAKGIAELNDDFRKNGKGRGRLMLTAGIVDLGWEFQKKAVEMTQQFSDFSEDNDPHSEHDFGAFELNGERVFWKLEYFDQNVEFGSPDPADPNVTTRVLTIMLACEY